MYVYHLELTQYYLLLPVNYDETIYYLTAQNSWIAMEQNPEFNREPDDSESEQETGENMDFEDSQDSVWTTQSTSNTTFDSNKNDAADSDG